MGIRILMMTMMAKRTMLMMTIMMITVMTMMMTMIMIMMTKTSCNSNALAFKEEFIFSMSTVTPLLIRERSVILSSAHVSGFTSNVC